MSLKLFRANQGARVVWVVCQTMQHAWELAAQHVEPGKAMNLEIVNGAIVVDPEYVDGPTSADDPVEVAERWQGHDRCEPDFDMNPEDTASMLASAVRKQAQEIAALRAARDEACEIASDIGNRIPRDGWSDRLREIRTVGNVVRIVLSEEQFDELTAAVEAKP